jgi:hypothetical protein
MSGHERVLCRHCIAVIRQCRCMGPHETTYETCTKCAREAQAVAAFGEALRALGRVLSQEAS